MKHISLHVQDIPAAPYLMDRRRSPDRRVEWRGGRRDGDWHTRPPGAWARVHGAHASSGLKRVLASLHLW